MTRATHHDHLRGAFTALLRELEPIWPREKLDYVREIAEHSEFGDALDNLLALAARDGHKLSVAAKQQVEHLADRMGLNDPHFMARLHAIGREEF